METTEQKIRTILKAVQDVYNVSYQEIVGKNRYKKIIPARHILYAALHKIGLSYSQIAQRLNRDHTTIIYGVNKAEKEFPREVVEITSRSSFIDVESIKHPYLGNSKKWRWVYEIYGGKCAICGFSDVVQVHHIVPRSIGGSDDIKNLIVLCPNHHALLHLGLVDIKTLSTGN